MLIFVHVSVYVRTIYAPIRYTSNRRPPRLRHGIPLRSSHFHIFVSITPLGGYCDTDASERDMLCMQRSALHSLTYIYVMHNEKVTDGEILFASSSHLIRPEPWICTTRISMSVQIKTERNLNSSLYRRFIQLT